ncbi:MAG: hypothetical protein KIS83_00830 [Rubrivivax sp.]|nr:hypothetical protein [Rubrivivax sp.]
MTVSSRIVPSSARSVFGSRTARPLLQAPLAAAALLALAACGGGGGGGGDTASANRAPVANAGPDLTASRSMVVALDGRASSDPDGDALSYSWRQVRGADATAGGTLSGANPSFTAPADVQTLEFELTVSDGKGGSHVDSVIVHVLEDRANALFVDGDAGSDATGTGTMDNPYASVRRALAAAGSSQADLYLRQRAGSGAYDETGATLAIPSGTSLYGGYGPNWERDVLARRTALRTDRGGVRYDGLAHEVWVSGLAVESADAQAPGETVYALRAVGNGQARITLEHNTLTAGHAVATPSTSAGSSHGVVLASLAVAAVYDNTITAGRGGNGSDGTAGSNGARGNDGSNGNRTGGRQAPGARGRAAMAATAARAAGASTAAAATAATVAWARRRWAASSWAATAGAAATPATRATQAAPAAAACPAPAAWASAAAARRRASCCRTAPAAAAAATAAAAAAAAADRPMRSVSSAAAAVAAA